MNPNKHVWMVMEQDEHAGHYTFSIVAVYDTEDKAIKERDRRNAELSPHDLQYTVESWKVD